MNRKHAIFIKKNLFVDFDSKEKTKRQAKNGLETAKRTISKTGNDYYKVPFVYDLHRAINRRDDADADLND